MTAAGIALRPAKAADAGRIATIFSASRALLEFLPRLHSAEEDRGFVSGHMMANCQVTVAETAGNICGFLAESPGRVEHLYCDPAQLRAGIGSILLKQSQARQQTLELWCFAENHGARAFYERHGFVAIEQTDGASTEEKRPDIRYRWTRQVA